MSHPEPSTADVQDVLDTTLDTPSLQAHIDAASHEVEDIKAIDSSVSDSRLTDIHKFLAAHYASSQDPRASSQSGESRSISYADRDSDANANYYGIAKRLDPTGVLAKNQKETATLQVPDARDIN